MMGNFEPNDWKFRAVQDHRRQLSPDSTVVLSFVQLLEGCNGKVPMIWREKRCESKKQQQKRHHGKGEKRDEVEVKETTGCKETTMWKGQLLPLDVVGNGTEIAKKKTTKKDFRNLPRKNRREGVRENEKKERKEENCKQHLIKRKRKASSNSN
ncbi:hypothetical protein X798_02331 [Onchocerca flexuosa]|uniref:Uncharacterized protein n=2 Tax=Onchocerca flexuosa TaxID=387005 RepID=A0A183I2W2_9BILA|nr:hypothetical protein X798_02331 [Onchocerca flexuosa]VDP15426.1 unnamed protein product [Onchocerca flexuosa]